MLKNSNSSHSHRGYKKKRWVWLVLVVSPAAPPVLFSRGLNGNARYLTDVRKD